LEVTVAVIRRFFEPQTVIRPDREHIHHKLLGGVFPIANRLGALWRERLLWLFSLLLLNPGVPQLERYWWWLESAS